MSDERKQDEAVRAGMKLAGFDSTLGVQIVEVSKDLVVLEYTVDERHLQPYGIVHGGVHCAVVESACSIGAGMAAAPRGQLVVGLDNHTSFVHALRGGKVRVTATPITRGRRSQLWEAVSRDESGRIVSSGRVRLLCLDPGTELAGETARVKS